MGAHYPGYKKTPTVDNSAGSALMRMQNQGYTKDELKRFRVACYFCDDSLMEAVPCKCHLLPTICERCRMLSLRKIFNPTNGRGRNFERFGDKMRRDSKVPRYKLKG
jgi:hypothetical protein